MADPLPGGRSRSCGNRPGSSSDRLLALAGLLAVLGGTWLGRPLPRARAADPAGPGTTRSVVQDVSVRFQERELGRGRLELTAAGEGLFGIRGRCRVTHPRTDRLYAFQMDSQIRLRGRKLEIVRMENRYNPAAAEHRAAIERLTPFLAVVLFSPVPSLYEGGAQSYLGPNGYYVLRYLPSHGGLEAALSCDDEVLARFHIRPAPAGQLQLTHVEVAATPGQMVEFVLQPPRPETPTARPPSKQP